MKRRKPTPTARPAATPAGSSSSSAGKTKPDNGGDPHEPNGEPPKEGPKLHDSVAQEKDRHRSEAGGESRKGADKSYDDDFGHARPYPV